MNTPMIIGRQTFDGLGRHLAVKVGENTTRFHYIDGQLPPSANTLADGRRVEFIYEPHLNNQLLSVGAEGEPAQYLGYHALGMPTSARGARGTERFEFTSAGLPSKDIWAVDGDEHVTTWRYSLNRLLQGFDDAQGVQHRRSFDPQGRTEEDRTGHLISRYRYDALSRLTHIDIKDPDNSRTLHTVLTYDSLGREHTRTLIATTQPDDEPRVTRTLKQSLGYSTLDQITSRYWSDGDRQGEETFEYDLRNRLTRYTADAEIAPSDPFGNPIIDQHFTFNALNGHKRVVTTFADGSTNETLFSYADGDPTRLIKVTHSHPSWPAEVELNYDACGRVIGDTLGRSMSWNAQGRLTQVTLEKGTCAYGYTASGHLTDRILDGTLKRSFFSGEDLTHEMTGDDSLQFCSGEQGMFAVNTVTDSIRQTTLLGCDAQGSVRLEADSAVRTRRYSAHGTEPESAESSPIGYAGQRTEPLTRWQILGDYRPYDPVLMCFLSPDSESPFGRGGINPYAYCAGDPVNRIDPDGHSWVNYALAGAGLAVGLAATVSALGAAAPLIASISVAGWSALTPSAVMTISAGVLDVVSLATGAAALITEVAGGDQRTANILGWVSLGTGIAAGALSTLAGPVARYGGRNPGPPTEYARRKFDAEIIFEKARGTHDVTFHKRLWGQDILGFESHGAPNGYVMNAKGIFEPAANVARKEIAPRLAGYENHRPLVLLVCEGGSSGAAQEVANVLRRPVIAFDAKFSMQGPKNVRSLIYEDRFYKGMNIGIDTSIPLQQIKGRRFGKLPDYIAGPNLELASTKYYLPQ